MSVWGVSGWGRAGSVVVPDDVSFLAIAKVLLWVGLRGVCCGSISEGVLSFRAAGEAAGEEYG